MKIKTKRRIKQKEENENKNEKRIKSKKNNKLSCPPQSLIEDNDFNSPPVDVTCQSMIDVTLMILQSYPVGR